MVKPGHSLSLDSLRDVAKIRSRDFQYGLLERGWLEWVESVNFVSVSKLPSRVFFTKLYYSNLPVNL